MALGWKTKSKQNLINKSPWNQTMRRHGHHLGTVGNKGLTTCSLREEACPFSRTVKFSCRGGQKN